jgi:hypothetical protein
MAMNATVHSRRATIVRIIFSAVDLILYSLFGGLTMWFIWEIPGIAVRQIIQIYPGQSYGAARSASKIVLKVAVNIQVDLVWK